MPEHFDPEEVQKLTREGQAFVPELRVDPSARRDLNFSSTLQVVSVKREALHYSINADLPRKLEVCKHCQQRALMKHGRYVIRLADLPYEDEEGRVMPVEYAIKAQRYKCSNCGHGDVEPLPDGLRPVVTSARITRRLSQWLLFVLQTETYYDTIARMTGYSKVWARKWYTEVRHTMNLPPKPSKPGRRKKK